MGGWVGFIVGYGGGVKGGVWPVSGGYNGGGGIGLFPPKGRPYREIPLFSAREKENIEILG
jgi:hypothetical protein